MRDMGDPICSLYLLHKKWYKIRPTLSTYYPFNPKWCLPLGTISLGQTVHYLGVSEPEKDKNDNENGKTPCPFPNIVNDGVCDASTNNLICDFDGGDCCDSSTHGSAYLLFCEGCECLNATTEVNK